VVPLLARPGVLALIVFLAFGAACRRKKNAPPAEAGGISCPAPEALAALVKEPSRIVRTDCVVYSPGFFWLAIALTTAEKPPAAPRLILLSGGGTPTPIAFDVDPMPAAAIERLNDGTRQLGVQIRKTRSSQHLVRLGVVARRPDGIEWEEVGILLQLAAHKPPNLLWTGPGDAAFLGADGCLTERRIEFEMPFRTDLQMFTTSTSRPTKPTAKNCPPSGPGTQEAVGYRPLPLKPGRKLP
jgi:hypothetical protein